MVNAEKNTARERALQINTKEAKNAYKLARTKERRLFRKKEWQFNQETLIDNEQHGLNDVRRPFEPQVAMCQTNNNELLTDIDQVLATWKEHFQEHLNEGSEWEQLTRPVDFRDDGVDMDLPSREEIEGALNYLKM
jgi:hypothetical protein